MSTARAADCAREALRGPGFRSTATLSASTLAQLARGATGRQHLSLPQCCHWEEDLAITAAWICYLSAQDKDHDKITILAVIRCLLSSFGNKAMLWPETDGLASLVFVFGSEVADLSKSHCQVRADGSREAIAMLSVPHSGSCTRGNS